MHCGVLYRSPTIIILQNRIKMESSVWRCNCNCKHGHDKNTFETVISTRDNLYYEKHLKQREKELLEKLIETRAMYNDLRRQILTRGDQINNKKVPTPKKGRKDFDDGDYSNTDVDLKAVIHNAVGVVDRGEHIIQPWALRPAANLSQCCSCCLCDPQRNRRRKTRYARVRKYPRKSNKIEKRSGSRLNLRRKFVNSGQAGKSIWFNSKNIKSDPCTCSHLKNLSEQKVVPKNVKNPEKNISTSPNNSIQSKVINLKHCICKINMGKVTKGSLSDSLKSSLISIKSKFHIKKDSLTIFRERLKKNHLKNWQRDPNACMPEECNPLECYETLKKKKKLPKSNIMKYEISEQKSMIKHGKRKQILKSIGTLAVVDDDLPIATRRKEEVSFKNKTPAVTSNDRKNLVHFHRRPTMLNTKITQTISKDTQAKRSFRKFKNKNNENIFIPRKCESLMCIPAKCDYKKCAKILLGLQKFTKKDTSNQITENSQRTYSFNNVIKREPKVPLAKDEINNYSNPERKRYPLKRCFCVLNLKRKHQKEKNIYLKRRPTQEHKISKSNSRAFIRAKRRPKIVLSTYHCKPTHNAPCSESLFFQEHNNFEMVKHHDGKFDKCELKSRGEVTEPGISLSIPSLFDKTLLRCQSGKLKLNNYIFKNRKVDNRQALILYNKRKKRKSYKIIKESGRSMYKNNLLKKISKRNNATKNKMLKTYPKILKMQKSINTVSKRDKNILDITAVSSQLNPTIYMKLSLMPYLCHESFWLPQKRNDSTCLENNRSETKFYDERNNTICKKIPTLTCAEESISGTGTSKEENMKNTTVNRVFKEGIIRKSDSSITTSNASRIQSSYTFNQETNKDSVLYFDFNVNYTNLSKKRSERVGKRYKKGKNPFTVVQSTFQLCHNFVKKNDTRYVTTKLKKNNFMKIFFWLFMKCTSKKGQKCFTHPNNKNQNKLSNKKRKSHKAQYPTIFEEPVCSPYNLSMSRKDISYVSSGTSKAYLTAQNNQLKNSQFLSYQKNDFWRNVSPVDKLMIGNTHFNFIKSNALINNEMRKKRNKAVIPIFKYNNYQSQNNKEVYRDKVNYISKHGKKRRLKKKQPECNRTAMVSMNKKNNKKGTRSIVQTYKNVPKLRSSTTKIYEENSKIDVDIVKGDVSIKSTHNHLNFKVCKTYKCNNQMQAWEDDLCYKQCEEQMMLELNSNSNAGVLVQGGNLNKFHSIKNDNVISKMFFFNDYSNNLMLDTNTFLLQNQSIAEIYFSDLSKTFNGSIRSKVCNRNLNTDENKHDVKKYMKRNKIQKDKRKNSKIFEIGDFNSHGDHQLRVELEKCCEPKHNRCHQIYFHTTLRTVSSNLKICKKGQLRFVKTDELSQSICPMKMKDNKILTPKPDQHKEYHIRYEVHGRHLQFNDFFKQQSSCVSRVVTENDIFNKILIVNPVFVDSTTFHKFYEASVKPYDFAIRPVKRVRFAVSNIETSLKTIARRFRKSSSQRVKKFLSEIYGPFNSIDYERCGCFSRKSKFTQTRKKRGLQKRRKKSVKGILIKSSSIGVGPCPLQCDSSKRFKNVTGTKNKLFIRNDKITNKSKIKRFHIFRRKAGRENTNAGNRKSLVYKLCDQTHCQCIECIDKNKRYERLSKRLKIKKNEKQYNSPMPNQSNSKINLFGRTLNKDFVVYVVSEERSNKASQDQLVIIKPYSKKKYTKKPSQLGLIQENILLYNLEVTVNNNNREHSLMKRIVCKLQNKSQCNIMCRKASCTNITLGRSKFRIKKKPRDFEIVVLMPYSKKKFYKHKSAISIISKINYLNETSLKNLNSTRNTKWRKFFNKLIYKVSLGNKGSKCKMCKTYANTNLFQKKTKTSKLSKGKRR